MKSSQLWEFYRSKVQVHRAAAAEQQLIFGGGERRCMECRDNQEKCDSIYFYISHDINTISSWLVLFPIFYFLPFRT